MAGQPRFGSGRVAASNFGRLKIVRPFEDGSAGRSKLKIGRPIVEDRRRMVGQGALGAAQLSAS